MKTVTQAHAEHELAQLAQRFDYWRHSRPTPRPRIPQALWDQAVALALQQHPAATRGAAGARSPVVLQLRTIVMRAGLQVFLCRHSLRVWVRLCMWALALCVSAVMRCSNGEPRFSQTETHSQRREGSGRKY